MSSREALDILNDFTWAPDPTAQAVFKREVWQVLAGPWDQDRQDVAAVEQTFASPAFQSAYAKVRQASRVGWRNPLDVSPLSWSLRGRSYRHWVGWLRVMLAEAVLDSAQQTARASVPWIPALLVIGAVPLAELAMLLIATAVMPWCAGGDRASSVWKRSVKNVYWSTTILIPAAAVATVISVVERESPNSDTAAMLFALLMLIGPPVVILRMLLTGAGRYVGPPQGPAFAPREPHCDRCGYTLIKLPAANNCPECGLPIRHSLPGGRRKPIAWQQNELRPRGFVELIRLQWVMLRDPTFFDRLPVQSGLPAARHFWWGTFLLILFSLLAVAKIGSLAAHRHSPLQMTFAGVAAVAVFAPLPLQAAMMFFGGLWSQFRYGMADYRVSAVVSYYAAPLMWPLMFALVLVPVMTNDPMASRLDGLKLHLFRSGDAFTAWHAALLSVAVLAGGLLSFWIRRLVTALRSVGYANL